LLAAKYIVENNVDGDVVECGVWRGGVSIMMAAVLKLCHSSKRLFCFDTFEGMDEQVKKEAEQGLAPVDWAGSFHADYVRSLSGLENVKNNFLNCELLDDNLVFIKGDVLQTLEDSTNVPEKIALLRLDTDLYDSTKRELEILYPRLVPGGILIIDDYGAWPGCKKATDEYFADKRKPFMGYIDRNARIGVKLGE
jgi:predicted O-methyltransferase YrrM